MNNWEITIQELQTKEGKKYKVTRRLPEYFIAETKRFISKEEALKQTEYLKTYCKLDTYAMYAIWKHLIEI